MVKYKRNHLKSYISLFQLLWLLLLLPMLVVPQGESWIFVHHQQREKPLICRIVSRLNIQLDPNVPAGVCKCKHHNLTIIMMFQNFYIKYQTMTDDASMPFLRTQGCSRSSTIRVTTKTLTTIQEWMIGQIFRRCPRVCELKVPIIVCKHL